MKNVTVAKRYAKALYQIALETQTASDILTGFSNLKHALNESPDLARALVNPLVKPEEKQAVVKAITSNKIILKFVFLLAKRKRMDLLETIVDEFVLLTDVDSGIQRVLVKSALQLDQSQRDAIEKKLSGSLGQTVIGHFQVAKELMGGIWIRLGDKVLDATVKGRFEDLRHHLMNSTN